MNYNVKYKLGDEIKSVIIEATSIDDARYKFLLEYPDAEIISIREMNYALVIILFIVLLILMILMPTITIFQNYVYNKITKKEKQSGPYFEKWRLRWLIIALAFDAFLIFFIISLTVIQNSTLNEILVYVLFACALGYDITYLVLSHKKKDLLYPLDGDSSQAFVEKKKNNSQAIDNNVSTISNNTTNTSDEKISDNIIDFDKEFENISIIKKYKQLLDDGIITKEEFNSKKNELLILE